MAIDDDEEDDEEIATAKEIAPNISETLPDDQQSALDSAVGTDDVQRDEADGPVKQSKQEIQEARVEKKKEEFLYNTEAAVTIFFSSHYRDKGLIW